MSDDEPSVHEASFEEHADLVEGESSLGKSLAAVKKFALERTAQSIEDIMGQRCDLQSWDVSVVKRVSGITQGLVEVDYTTPDGKKLRNRAEVAAHCGITPSIKKNNRALTREQHYLCSVEYREKLLLSQQLGLLGSTACDLVSYANDEILTSPAPTSLGFFTIGNCSVLNWGKIIPHAGFHTSTLLFPLGFRCLRLEHDTFLDTVVDCLCEVDALCTNAAGETELFSSLSSIFADGDCGKDCTAVLSRFRTVEPHFRVSVHWHLGNGAKAVKVYEARTPQHAWQAAMLETLGMREEDIPAQMLLNVADGTREAALRAKETDSYPCRGKYLNPPPSCSPDEEEQRLRTKIRDSRRNYFRALRTEQLKGTKVAAKPRLQIDRQDSFVGDTIMRMVEGMEGVLDCEEYVLYEARDRESGIKAIWKEYGIAQKKVKTLDQAIRQHALQSEQKQLFSNRKRKAGDNSDDEMDTKETRALVHAALKARHNKARDIEKAVTAIKNNLNKVLKKRKEEVKSIIESYLVLQTELGGRDRRRQQPLQLQLHPPPLPTPLPPALEDSPRPEPADGPTCLPQTIFSQMLEVWVFIHQFAESHFSSASPPDLDTFFRAMLDTHPVLGDIRRRLGRHSTEVRSTAPSSAQVLNTIGAELTKTLMSDFERGMGMDGAAETQLGNMSIPINALTWREVARLAILVRACKDVGLTENEMSALMKGRGYSTSPDSLDRKALKLARKRILQAFSIRHEVQETAFGFRSGLVVRIPAPSTVRVFPLRYWQWLLPTIAAFTDQEVWMLPSVLQHALWLMRNSGSGLASHGETVLRDALRDIGKGLTVLAVDSSWLRQRACAALTTCANICGAGCAAGGSATTKERTTIPPVSSSAEPIGNAIRQFLVEVSSNSLLETEPSVAGPSTIAELNGEEEEGVEPEPMELSEMPSSAPEDDAVLADQLPLPMQRCYYVLRALMEHVDGGVIAAVIPSTAAGFRRRARRIVTLADIRKVLVRGSYGTSLLRFYYDATRVLETVYICCLDNINNRTTVLRLMIIFERLFFEMVLCHDHPLPYSDSCHVCRSHEGVPAGRAAVCERCEGVYHIDCLDPPLPSPPRSEWNCPACIEQRGVAQAHPYRIARVQHPSGSGVVGEVVGIEQHRQQAVFIVDFGKSREPLSGELVRRFALPPSAEHESYDLPEGYCAEDYDQVCGVCRAYTGFCSPICPTPPVLVDGYSKIAALLHNRDVDFAVSREAISILSSTDSSSDELTCEDWLVVFRALIYHSLRSSFNAVPMPTVDEQEGLVMDVIKSLRATGGEVADPSKQSRREEEEEGEEEMDEEEADAEAKSTDELPLGQIAKNSKGGRRVGTSASQSSIAGRSSSEFDVDMEMSDSDSDSNSDSDSDDFSLEEEEESLRSMSSDENGEEESSDEDDEEDEENGVEEEKNGAPNGESQELEYEDDFQDLYESDAEQPADEADMWQLQVKGREDALQSFVAVQEAVATLDLDYKTGAAVEESQPIVRKQLGDFWPQAMAAVVKTCICKAPDGDGGAWTKGWEGKMQALIESTPDKALTPVCELCSTGEDFLCNPFVWMPSDISSLPSTAVSGSTVLWPLADEEADDADNESSASRGKLVHSYCADTLVALKALRSKPKFNPEDLALAERVCPSRWPSIVSLGSDRQGGNYWMFTHCQYILVQRVVAEQRHVWSIYRSDQEKSQLLAWLSDQLPCEAALKRALCYLNNSAERRTPSILNSNSSTINSTSSSMNGNGAHEESQSRTIIQKKKRDARFSAGDVVFIANDRAIPLFWQAQVLQVEFVEGRWMCKVALDDWTFDSDVFLPEEQLFSEDEALRKMNSLSTTNSSNLEAAQANNRQAFLNKAVFTAPEVLQSLQARQFLHLPDRACGQRPPMGFSSCTTMLEQLRAAMLIIESALPCGSIDDSEDRWADGFVVAWREAVAVSSDPVSLMQCQLMLEYGIRTSWLKPTGLKMLSCLPSRVNCLRHATYSAIAMRMWILDQTIKYDKTQTPAVGEKAGSKAAAAGSQGSDEAGSAKKKKKKR